jgi:hypothetical protein
MAEQTNDGGMIPWRKSRGPAPKYTDEEVADAIEQADGVLSDAAEILKCSTTTVYNYVNESEALQTVLYLAREKRKDKYEKALDKRRDAGSDAAIIFYLKTQAKDRGYIERSELDTNININVNIDDDFNPPTSEDAQFEIDDEPPPDDPIDSSE